MDANITIDEPRLAIHQPFRERLPLPPGKRFHIFFSYTNVSRDKLWVKRVIAKLEKEYGFTCCDHERDFLPGTKIMDNIKDGLMNSEKVVVLFSKESIDSDYVSLEAEMAFKRSIEARKNLVIPILLDDCDVPEEYLLLTYIDAREGVEETTWWPKLMKSIESSGEASRRPFYVEGKNVAAGKAFAITQLCSIETKFNFPRCCMEENFKYSQEQLRPEAFGVPVDLIRAIKEDLIQRPGVVYRQKMSCIARISMVIGYLAFLLFHLHLLLGIYFLVYPSEKYAAVPFFSACYIFFIPCLLTWRLHRTVPVDLIRATNIDHLQRPGMVCRQKMSCIARIVMVFEYLVLLCFLPNLVFAIRFFVVRSETYEAGPYKTAKMFVSGFCAPLYFAWRVYIQPIGEQNPNSVHNNIIDYNRILSKYGVMVTVVPGYMWKTASLIFYNCKFELCKEYVIRHLVDEGSTNKTEHKHIPDSEQVSASYDGSSFLSGVGKLIRHRGVKQSTQIINEINQVMAEVAEDVSDVAEVTPLLSNQGTENLDYQQSTQIVNEINQVMAEVAEDVSDVAEDTPLLSNQGTENLDYQTRALDLLMRCTPEYFALAYANKLKNLKEDRHGINVMCLCQYLEHFRERV